MQAKMQANMAHNILGQRESQFLHKKDYIHFQGYIYGENTLKKIKLFFSRISGLISAKLSTKHSWVKRIVQMKYHDLFSMGDDQKYRKYTDNI